MIRLPKEVKNVLKTLEEKGFTAFAVGGCVRDSLVGLKPYDWDVTTSAGLEELQEIFPEAKVISDKYSVVRLKFTQEVADEDGNIIGEEGIVVDMATFRKDGTYSDGRRPDYVEFVDTVEEDLKRRDFTMNAIADNGSRVVDIFDGVGDINKKIIKTVGDPAERFREDPVRMLRAIRFASELNFDLAKNVYEAIVENYRLLEKVSMDRFRKEFVSVMGSAYCGKGLKMLVDTGIFNLILGDNAIESLNRREKSEFLMLCDNVDVTKQVPERRLGLLYTVIGKKMALASIEKMNFDSKTKQYLVDAVHDMPKLYFTSNKEAIKKFIYSHSWDRYNYLANLEKAQRLVFNYDSRLKIEGRMYFVEQILNNNEPIFPEDMAIDGNDLIEAGICKGEEVGKMLTMLVERLHAKPELNKRSELLDLARKYKKNKLAAYTRGINWLQ